MARLTMSSPGVIENPSVHDADVGYGDRWLVTVFNNETNTYDEVMTILMIATQCDVDEAFMETWEIDHLGQSVVHHGDQTECESAAEIIAQIGIRVEVSQEP